MNQPTPVTDEAFRTRASTAGDVRAELTFIVRQDEKPYFESAALTGGDPKVYFDTELRAVTIHDMRRVASTLSLDRTGFVLRQHATSVQNLHDDDLVDDDYGREQEDLLEAFTGADRVVVFDHTRRSDSATGAANRDGLRAPASRVHVDYTVDFGPQRARDTLGAEEVERVLSGGGRIVQVNVWRPIAGPVRRAPLALADASSIEARDLIATDRVFSDRVGEIYQLAYGPQQRWYWAPEMQRDEVIIIKGWDSLDDGRARFTPHGAFRLPDQDPQAPPRESIESRTYLVFEG